MHRDPYQFLNPLHYPLFLQKRAVFADYPVVGEPCIRLSRV
jgi:hypothetical protein